jgi:hypothetical protein
MKILSLFLFLTGISCWGQSQSSLISDCESTLKKRGTSVQDSTKFCSCLSEYVYFQNSNFDQAQPSDKAKLVKSGTLSCTREVKIEKDTAWTDKTKLQMVQGCRNDKKFEKLVNGLSDLQHEVFCECYVDRITKAYHFIELQHMDKDKLTQSLANKAVSCSKKAQESFNQ